jgi:hypothetical protein
LERRRFLNSLAASALAIGGSKTILGAQQDAVAGGGREYYELRRYHLISGPQQKLTESFLAEAFIPALNRHGMKPIGVFNLYLGPETPAVYVLIPSRSADALVNLELTLGKDEEYWKAGAKFLQAPAKEPAYERVESSLMIAFEGWPKLKMPPASAEHGARVFQLRTYESPSSHDHRVKVEMFHNGEFEIFEKAGFWNVFFGDTLIGPRLPNLTYMLSFPDLAEMNAKWKAFSSDPDWKKLSGSSKFNYESIVSNISNLILNPASCSQI